jgi:methyl-accepting chemotaxis protein
MTTETRNINIAILAGAIIIIGLCIIIYGYRLTRKIRYLTEAAYRISVGDLEAEIEIRSNDEIGSLADAISRMQDSLRFSIERLRRRR